MEYRIPVEDLIACPLPFNNLLFEHVNAWRQATWLTGKTCFKFIVKATTIISQKIKFSLKISSVNMTKSAVFCGFGHIY